MTEKGIEIGTGTGIGTIEIIETVIETRIEIVIGKGIVMEGTTGKEVINKFKRITTSLVVMETEIEIGIETGTVIVT